MVIDVFTAAHSRRDVEYTYKGKTYTKSIDTVDAIFALGPSSYKTKDSDAPFHIGAFRHILLHYKELLGPDFDFASMTSDGAPNTYKYALNFLLTALLAKEMNLRIAHDFALPDYFKCIVDALNAVIKSFGRPVGHERRPKLGFPLILYELKRIYADAQ